MVWWLFFKKKPKEMLVGKLLLVSLGIFILSGTGYYIINQGGTGLALPVNTLAWGVMALLVLFIGFKVSAVSPPQHCRTDHSVAVCRPAGLSRAVWRFAVMDECRYYNAAPGSRAATL